MNEQRPPTPYGRARKVRASEVREGSRWELSEGELVWVGRAGGDGARGTIAGAEVLDTDPAVEEAGIDAGYAPDDETLRAPDVSVGNVPDAPGWVKGAPPLAVEYAGRGQDEEALQKKIGELLEAGTRWVWVVRLLAARRVEVHVLGAAVETKDANDHLLAPGVLQNPVPVAALFDRRVAHEVALRNLLQRKGYAGLEDVLARGRAEGIGLGREQGLELGREEGFALGREEGLEQGLEQGREQGLEQGREQGRIEARRRSARDLCEVLGIDLEPSREARIESATEEELEALVAALKQRRAWPD